MPKAPSSAFLCASDWLTGADVHAWQGVNTAGDRRRGRQRTESAMVQAWGVWGLGRPEGHRGDSAEPATCSPGPLGEERGTRLENHGRPLPQDRAAPLLPRLSPAPAGDTHGLPPHTEQPAALQRAAVPFPCRASPRVCSTGRKGFSLRSRLAQLVTRRSWEHEAGASQRPGTRPGPRQPSARGRWSPRGPPLSGRPVRCCRIVLLPREAGRRERLWPPLHSRRGARRPPRWPWLAVPRLHS